MQNHAQCLAPDMCGCPCLACSTAYQAAGAPRCPHGPRVSHEDLHEVYVENGATVITRRRKCPACQDTGFISGGHSRSTGGMCGVCKPTPEATTTPAKPVKHDTGKPALARIFVLGSALDAVARALAYGHGKYGDDVNWQKVEAGEDRYLSAACRHVAKHVQGRLLDDEPDEQGRPGSGLPHLWHAACSLLMALWHAGPRLQDALRGAKRQERDG